VRCAAAAAAACGLSCSQDQLLPSLPLRRPVPGHQSSVGFRRGGQPLTAEELLLELLDPGGWGGRGRRPVRESSTMSRGQVKVPRYPSEPLHLPTPADLACKSATGPASPQPARRTLRSRCPLTRRVCGVGRSATPYRPGRSASASIH
jgi:hypothetical protein